MSLVLLPYRFTLFSNDLSSVNQKIEGFTTL
nr:MAG TPA: hypothetical protein [Bacteriophage sp.]